VMLAKALSFSSSRSVILISVISKRHHP
jgi:hypothetical protein